MPIILSLFKFLFCMSLFCYPILFLNFGLKNELPIDILSKRSSSWPSELIALDPNVKRFCLSSTLSLWLFRPNSLVPSAPLSTKFRSPSYLTDSSTSSSLKTDCFIGSRWVRRARPTKCNISNSSFRILEKKVKFLSIALKRELLLTFYISSILLSLVYWYLWSVYYLSSA